MLTAKYIRMNELTKCDNYNGQILDNNNQSLDIHNCGLNVNCICHKVVKFHELYSTWLVSVSLLVLVQIRSFHLEADSAALLMTNGRSDESPSQPVGPA